MTTKQNIYRLRLIGISAIFNIMISPLALPNEKITDSTIIPPVSDFPQSDARQVTGGPFRLVSHAGRTVTEKDFKDSFLLIYFGYSYCPDVCPTDLSIMGNAIDLMAREGDKVQPIFITFDPMRDTKDHLAGYIKNFHPRLIGLTGTREQTLAAANQFGVDVSSTYKAEITGSAYSMNHSAFTYLVDPNRKLRVMFRHGTNSKLMADTIRRHIHQ